MQDAKNTVELNRTFTLRMSTPHEFGDRWTYVVIECELVDVPNHKSAIAGTWTPRSGLDANGYDLIPHHDASLFAEACSYFYAVHTR